MAAEMQPPPAPSSRSSSAEDFGCVFLVELERGPSGLGMGLIDGTVSGPGSSCSPEPGPQGLWSLGQLGEAHQGRGAQGLVGTSVESGRKKRAPCRSHVPWPAMSPQGVCPELVGTGVQYCPCTHADDRLGCPRRGCPCVGAAEPEACVSPQHTPLGAPGLYIQTLLPGSPAAADGRLSLGDRILEVNGSSLVGVSYLRYPKHTHTSVGAGKPSEWPRARATCRTSDLGSCDPVLSLSL